jgi:hypothetical protein
VGIKKLGSVYSIGDGHLNNSSLKALFLVLGVGVLSLTDQSAILTILRWLFPLS